MSCDPSFANYSNFLLRKICNKNPRIITPNPESSNALLCVSNKVGVNMIPTPIRRINPPKLFINVFILIIFNFYIFILGYKLRNNKPILKIFQEKNEY